MKRELIISSSPLFLQTLIDNLPLTEGIEVITTLNNLELFDIIHLAILDLKDSPPPFPIHKIKSIINIGSFIIRADEIRLKLPLSLKNLLKVINQYRTNNFLFLSINKDWIYSYELMQIFNNDTNIKLTAKENEIFNYLCIHKNLPITKQELLTIFNYWDDYYIEIHLYRLKNKLPEALLTVHSDYFLLNINN